MANEVLVGLKIGAIVSGSLSAAFGSARSTVQQLGRATDSLTTKQKLMGTDLAASIARGGSGVERLRRQYDQVGRTIEQLKTKQESLNTSIARGETLKSKRADLRGQAMETIGTGVAIGAPIVQSVRTAIEFQDQTRDIAITGGFDEAEEKRLSDVMRASALKWNQTQTEVANGTGVLVAGGISNAKELAAYAPVLAKTATATRASMDDLGKVALALNDNLGIGAAGLERSMNMLAYAGKEGRFELKDMAKWLPQLTPQFAALGVTGEKAVAEIGASLQVAMKGAGSTDEAANNFKNFLTKITAPDTLKSFSDAGIDLKESIKNLVSTGLTPTQAMLETITNYMGTKSPKAASEFQKAIALTDDTERETALNRLNEAYKLGELFRDMQVLSYLRPALANQAEQARVQKGSMGAADKDVTGQDWAKRMGSPKEQLKLLGVNLSDIGISIGSALIPALVDVTQALVPVMASFSAWASENPGIIKGVVGLVGGLLAGKLAFIGLAYGANLVMSPFVAMSTTITTVSSKWTLLRGMWQMGKFAPLVTGLTRIGGGLLTVAKYSGLFLRGVTMALGAPLMMAARGGLFLGKILGGTLLYGLQLAGQAVLWLGRALLMNPIGLLITGTALSAYLIYRYWEPIKGFFSGLWTEVKAGFNGGLSGITGLILDFSPLGLFYRAFAGVMSYFGIELPGKFSEFGGLILGKLADGITNTAIWGQIRAGFSGGISGIGELILNFSPLGLFYQAFAGVMSYFGVELPGKFSEFGGMLVTGLISGISNMAGSLKDSVVGIGTSIKGWFTGEVQIRSPSRVFMGYGANISEGAALGITSQSDLVRKAALGMAAQSKVDLAPATHAAPNPSDVSRASMMGGMSGTGQIGTSSAQAVPIFQYSPQINVTSGPDVREQLTQALRAGYADFEKNMDRYLRDRRRRSYGPSAEGFA
ncbi:phage tail tape measure protein [Pseudomonas sp. J380]|uniref:phage tail tape measure protein n=1 Tax=Pseudomonas sp. J380 TaxID=2605424 RepID=UPI0013180E5F|nr:phage tail tape measure protein [Pseudomonas sp. J380]QHA95850.1 phage tail tape measure protein [Pseudomonas sp. J380]